MKVRRAKYGGITSIIFGIIWCSMISDRFESFYIFPSFSFFNIIGIICIITGIVQVILQVVNKKEHIPKDHTDMPYSDSHSHEYNSGNNNYSENILKCPMCNSEVDKDQKFCINCGYRLKD
ncbi:MAG TPA: zinc ribbon domain-containing protein [Clostridia bacterium]